MAKTSSFRGKRVLITGGAGFIGSNLAIELVNQGAKVTILDNLTPGQGGNIFNLSTIEKDISIDFSDIRDDRAVKAAVRGKDYVFHLARQTDHILSLTNPYPDIDVNVRGTTVLLEALRYVNPTAKLIYTGTRGQYGNAITLPVAEDAPTNPRGIYEITNLTAEKIVKIYHDVHHISSVMLRLTNIYGPRSQMSHDRFGVVNWFVRLAIEGKTIRVFGDGKLKRDFVYIDDCIDAMLRCASTDACYGEIINIGKDEPEDFLTLVQTIIKEAKSGSWEYAPFTPERAAQEPGNFASDVKKILRLTGWKPTRLFGKAYKKLFIFTARIDRTIGKWREIVYRWCMKDLLPSLSFLIPAYKDADTVPSVIRECVSVGRRVAKTFDILVLEDGSPDDTYKTLVRVQKKTPQMKLFRHTQNKGYGETIKDLYYLGKKEWLFSVPGDGQIAPSELLKLVPYAPDSDIILGWRDNRHDPRNRLLQSRVYNTLLRIIHGIRVHDVNSVRLMRRTVIERIQLTSRSAFVDAEMVIRATRMGMRVREYPIEHISRGDESGAGGGHLATILPTIREMVQFR